jgi:hypothetical protein
MTVSGAPDTARSIVLHHHNWQILGRTLCMQSGLANQTGWGLQESAISTELCSDPNSRKLVQAACGFVHTSHRQTLLGLERPAVRRGLSVHACAQVAQMIETPSFELHLAATQETPSNLWPSRISLTSSIEADIG